MLHQSGIKYFLLSILLVSSVFTFNSSAQSGSVTTTEVGSQANLSAPKGNPNYSQKSGRGYLGVYLGDISEEKARQLKLSEARGAIIGKVEDGSPAAKAGLQENDIILSFNAQKIQVRSDLYSLIIDSSPKSKVNLEIRRNGEILTIPVELGQRRTKVLDERQRLYNEVDAMLAAAEDRHREAEDLRQKGDEKGAQTLLEEEKLFLQQAADQRKFIDDQIREGKLKQNIQGQTPNFSVNANRYRLGVTVIGLSDQLLKYFNVSRAVLISEVRADGASERAGVKVGDCVIAVNDKPVDSVAAFNQLIDKLGKDSDGKENPAKEKAGIDLVLLIARDGNQQKIKIQLDSR